MNDIGEMIGFFANAGVKVAPIDESGISEVVPSGYHYRKVKHNFELCHGGETLATIIDRTEELDLEEELKFLCYAGNMELWRQGGCSGPDKQG